MTKHTERQFIITELAELQMQLDEEKQRLLKRDPLYDCMSREGGDHLDCFECSSSNINLDCEHVKSTGLTMEAIKKRRNQIAVLINRKCASFRKRALQTIASYVDPTCDVAVIENVLQIIADMKKQLPGLPL